MSTDQDKRKKNKSVVMMSSSKVVKVRVNSGTNYKSNQSENFKGLDLEQASLPKQVIQLVQLYQQNLNGNSLKQPVNFSKQGASMNDSSFMRGSPLNFDINNSFKDQKLNGITPVKKKHNQTSIDDSMNNMSTIKRAQSPMKSSASTTISSSIKQKISKRFLSDKTIDEIKESNSTKEYKTTRDKKLNKIQNIMKLRPERLIVIDNPLALKKSMQKSLVEQSQIQSMVKLPLIDNEIFNYPLMLWDYYITATPDDILFEGELMKYMPGFKYQYFKKYCLLTKTTFKYYKNELMSFKHIFPLQSISLDDIEKVQRVNVEIPTLQPEEECYNHYQFEIFVNKSAADGDDVEASLAMPHNYIEESKVDISQIDHEQQRQNRFQRTNRLMELFGGRGDRRFLESPERRSFKVLPRRYYSETRFKSAGHMMPKMIERRLVRFNSLSVQRLQDKSRIQQQQPEKIYRKIDVSNLFSEHKLSLQQKHEYMQFIDEVQDDLAIPVQKETYENKNPAGWIKNLGGFQSWSNREAEWFNAETRLLFGCLSEKECDRWVVLLNWLISQRKKN